MTNNEQQLKIKVIAKLVSWGNNPTEVAAMVEENFKHAVEYGFRTPAKIAHYIRIVA